MSASARAVPGHRVAQQGRQPLLLRALHEPLGLQDPGHVRAHQHRMVPGQPEDRVDGARQPLPPVLGARLALQRLLQRAVHQPVHGRLHSCRLPGK